MSVSTGKLDGGECGDEFMLKHGYFCERPKGHNGDHECECPNPQFHQSWPQQPFNDDMVRRADLPKDAMQLIHDIAYHHPGRDVADYVLRAQNILKVPGAATPKPKGDAGTTKPEVKIKSGE